MGNIWRSFIRMSAFLRKEIFEILRQPRLVFTLVLGPFLILLIFGIGYKAEALPLRTVFVVEEGSPLVDQIESYATTLGPQLVYGGVTHNGEEALDLLRDGDIDIVAVAPPDAIETIRNNQPAVFTLYHREIDPFQVDYVRYFGQVYVDEVNRRVLQEMTLQTQQDASQLTEDLRAARASASALNSALRAGDQAAAMQHNQSLGENVDNISLVVGATLGLLRGVEGTVGGPGTRGTGSILETMNQLREDQNQLQQGNESQQAQVERSDRIETGLADLEENLLEFQRVDPEVLVSPFRSEVKGITAVQPTAPEFFAPAVLALLMQHLAVTFAALSVVRERMVGTMELFRVSPLSAAEALLGKYISYLLFGGFIGLALTLLMVFVLRIPMLGMWENYALVLAAILFTSLSIGFVISIYSQNDSQAVQYTMIVLLASVFFSGFLMSLNMLWEPVRIVSWMLPTTYGIVMLRDIMLLGQPPEINILGGLAGIGFALLVVAWLSMRRLISRSQK